MATFTTHKRRAPRKPTRADLEQQIADLKAQVQNLSAQVGARRDGERAQAVLKDGTRFDYVCSLCGDPCYYDGRCGDGPILMCACPRR